MGRDFGLVGAFRRVEVLLDRCAYVLRRRLHGRSLHTEPPNLVCSAWPWAYCWNYTTWRDSEAKETEKFSEPRIWQSVGTKFEAVVPAPGAIGGSKASTRSSKRMTHPLLKQSQR